MLVSGILVVLTAAVAQSDAERFQEASEAYQAKKYDVTIELLDPFLQEKKSGTVAAQARQLASSAFQERGMDHFCQARVKESIADFDRAIELAPQIERGHWQRGISYYYADQFEKGARQFEQFQTIYSYDVENSAWHFLCKVRSPGGSVAAARENLIPIERDVRVPMAEIHRMFAGELKPEVVLAAAEKSQSASATFYADLYVGLYYEALGDAEKSLRYISAAADHPDPPHTYMHAVAVVHRKLRQDKLDKSESQE